MSGINLQELRAQRAMERKMNVEKDHGGIIHSQVQIFVHFSHIILGRSWADHGATMGDHAKHARF